ncbi:MCE family protein [[Mycobacterium] wendilense]|uniref:MCE family protein n=1 Tax=[Mycobacterium] wendilense TaxID=3064284 RepID=A0ABM9MJQ2_9MYCO|nr:MCE family protein [Mycolicibacterium sp. MU0050]CAJ1586836.1 MCE family protein [Mycolicibacterium sp. MU0050]
MVIGLCFAMVAAIASVSAVAKSRGDLDRVLRVSAELTNVGDGLPEKSDVKFRGVLVGQVSKVETTPMGQPNTVHLQLKPGLAAGIPGNVTARVVPSNIFAVSSVQLVDNGDGAAPLRSGAAIPEDTSLPTVLFQTTLNKFRKVFAALAGQPTERGVGLLATLSEATHGRGDSIRAAGRDLKEIVTELDTVLSDGSDASTIAALTEATDALRDAAPELFDALDRGVRPMRTLAEKRESVSSFLAAATHTSLALAESFENQTDRLINITTQLTPVVGVLADNAEQFPMIAGRIQRLSENVLNVYDHETRQLTVKTILSLTPTRSYVRADCPRYGELSGPSCETAPEVPAAPQLYPALGSMGIAPPAGVSENRPNHAPPRDSTRHGGQIPGGRPPGAAESVPQPPAAVEPVPDAVPKSAGIGGNVGPVGSAQEGRQLSMITGTVASPATHLLLGPVVRGSTVHLLPESGGHW